MSQPSVHHCSATDWNVRNDWRRRSRWENLCVPDKDPRYSKVRSLQDLAPHRLNEIAEFSDLQNLEQRSQKFAAGKMLIRPLVEKCIKAGSEKSRDSDSKLSNRALVWIRYYTFSKAQCTRPLAKITVAPRRLIWITWVYQYWSNPVGAAGILLTSRCCQCYQWERWYSAISDRQPEQSIKWRGSAAKWLIA